MKIVVSDFQSIPNIAGRLYYSEIIAIIKAFVSEFKIVIKKDNVNLFTQQWE
jgi:hypothetical protein